MPHSILILPGDGIGPEVMTEVRKIIDWFQDAQARSGLRRQSEDLVGGAAYDAHGTPLHRRRDGARARGRLRCFWAP